MTNKRLTRYLVELDWPTLALEDVEALGSRSRAAADALRAEGGSTRFLRTIYVPEDGRCYLLFEGCTRSDVQRALELLPAAGADRRALVAAIRLTSTAKGA